LLPVSTMLVGFALRHRSSSTPSTNTLNEACFAEVHIGRTTSLGIVKKSLTQPQYPGKQTGNSGSRGRVSFDDVPPRALWRNPGWLAELYAIVNEGNLHVVRQKT